ncbi:hypothetical protein GLOIN_2v1541345 [Rhizophagus irregularis DAOM 181602=DAOM 197198]|nr:hypothetical protein GLOIN_2v1541345 [Rhizophagus irregularis DAOM 181602=DAOM 197198]CAB4377669.1 unnamed protein product [Rhizophagus irregularis]CAB4483013.1 unnamed protein product [Rhizophagus irregularis]
MQVKRSIEQVEPQLLQELVIPIKRQKSSYEWEVFLELFPFNLSEPYTTETPIIADYNNIQEMDLNKSVAPHKLEVESIETLEFSEVDNNSDSYASEESEFEVVIKKKKRCGAMWSPECRRARRWVFCGIFKCKFGQLNSLDWLAIIINATGLKVTVLRDKKRYTWILILRFAHLRSFFVGVIIVRTTGSADEKQKLRPSAIVHHSWILRLHHQKKTRHPH